MKIFFNMYYDDKERQEKLEPYIAKTLLGQMSIAKRNETSSV